MNFGSGAGGGGGGNGEGNASEGPDLEQISTEQLAFQSASGEDKLQLLPSPWPTDNLPPTTSSLLSIASSKGLVAAAGPNALIIATTDGVRQSLRDGKADGDKTKPFTPQVTIQTPRISQVAFSSDDSCLVIAAEQGGGLAVYDTNAIMNGGKEAAFQLATQGQSVRHLIPNPNPSQDLSRYFGVVTENGQLLLADLQQQKLVQASNGSNVFHENVSCACWSRLGKQIVAGLADGTAVQIDQQGVVKAQIPEPPQLASWKDSSALAHPITSIFWLETHDFLIVHTPISAPDTMANADSIYHLARRDKSTSSWTFNKFVDPCPAFGMERRPAQHFIQRLRDWLDLNELLILSSPASTDIGIFTRSKSALDPEHAVIDTYTYTEPPDSRRAAMPMGVDDSDTSPIGMAIDLSVKEKAPRPIPTEETMEESPNPLPALYVLNNEGKLRMWYIIYNNAIRQAVPYPDLIAAGGPRPLGEQKQPQPQQAQLSSPTSPFGSSAPSSLPFGQPQQQKSNPFGAPSQAGSTFGQTSTPAFGDTSAMGNRASPWTSGGNAQSTQAAFGSSTFGQASMGGAPTQNSQPKFGSSTFGQASGMGMGRGSVWGTANQQQNTQQTPSSTGVFGGNAAQSSPFLNVANQQKSAGFSSFANATQSPFATANKSNLSSGSSGSAFGNFGKENHPTASPWTSGASKPTLSAEPSGSTISFGNGTSFGSGSTNFGITSFQSSPTPTPQQPQSREESMDDDNEEASKASAFKPASQTPATTQPGGAGLFGLGSGGFQLGSSFKPDGSAKDDLPKPKNPGAGLFGSNFGSALGLDDKPAASSQPAKDALQPASEAKAIDQQSTPVIKKEPGTEEEPNLRDIPAAAPAKDEEETAPADDAPLPPDPTTWKPKPGALPPPIPPGFGADFVKPAKKQEDTPKESSVLAAATAPPPPSIFSSTKDSKAKNITEALASPVSSKEAAGPPESEDEDGEWSDEEGEDEEGFEEDEGDEDEDDEHDELESPDHTPQVIDSAGLSAFEARLTPASPKRSDQLKSSGKESTTPGSDKRDSYTPAGLPKAPMMFQPPQRLQGSPRSPSPQRSATSPVRSMAPTFGASQATSATANVPSLRPTSQKSLPSAQAPLPPQSRDILQASTGQGPKSTSVAPQTTFKPPQRIAVPPSQLVKPEKSIARTKPQEVEQGELEDDEDQRIQAILAAPIEPTRDLPSFLAHQDYVANGQEKEGLGGQIERVFRDVNSMIDTLALNARSLQAFIEGNSRTSTSRSRLDLEEEENWTIGEGVDLEKLVEGIIIELEDGRLEDARGAIEGLKEEEVEINRLRTRTAEVRKTIAARSDPDQVAQHMAAPLPMESQAQQSGLRQGVLDVQRLLSKAEEQLSLLRAELASLPASNGVGDRKSSMPTVEAVTNTILKMTAMIEKKSGDIDVLESRIKRLGGPAALSLKPNYEDDLATSMKASRLSSTSPALLKSSRASMFSSPSRMRASRMTPGTLEKKSLFDVPDAELEAYRIRREGRRRAMDRLREQLEARGLRVIKARH